MTLLLKQLFAFIKLLNSDTGHNQIAAGLALGIVLGFSPMLSLQALLVFLIAFFFRVQLGAALLSAFFFKFVAFLIDPVADQVGQFALELPSLRPLYIEMYNMPLVPLTRFNNSIVMGGAIISLLAVVPAYFVFQIAILKYRVNVVAKFEDTKFWKALKATGFYKWYATYKSLYG